MSCATSDPANSFTRLVCGNDGSEVRMTEVYTQLRQIAAVLFKGERSDHTLQATALANEAYIRLFQRHSTCWDSREHFFGAAARAMKQILIDHARKRDAHKRGGSMTRVELNAEIAITPSRPAEFLAVADALERLADLNKRQGRIVELRFYAGLTIREAAEVLGLGVTTVKADWAEARAWLHKELSAES
jgi:RNA polymerase sigma factor (TIGR02999 family)